LILEARIGNRVEVRVWPMFAPSRRRDTVCLRHSELRSIAGFRLSKPSELELVLITAKLSRLDVYRGNPVFCSITVLTTAFVEIEKVANQACGAVRLLRRSVIPRLATTLTPSRNNSV
jgi:hypothetical protein